MVASLLKAWRKRSPDASPDRDALGLQGEEAASRFLVQKGFKILVKRYRCRYGEVDLTARDGDVLVFVEVKTRSSEDHGSPHEAVTLEKQRHISRVALDYLRQLNHPSIPVRFDIVEVIENEGGTQCHHIMDAFPLSEPYVY